MTALSEHFTVAEFEDSYEAIRRGIDNKMPIIIRNDAMELCENVLEPLREKLGKPIRITSGYRCYELNKAIGGSATSQHCRGQAVDIKVKGIDPTDVAKAIIELGVYDQVIDEGNWTHVSYKANCRHVKLTAHFENGGVHYTEGIA